jgi:hypothetical protein
MRYPSAKNLGPVISLFMLFLLGMLAGMILQLFFHGQELERLHLKIDELKTENTKLQNDLNAYKEAEKKRSGKSQNVIEDIDIIIESNSNDFIKLELIRRMDKELVHLKGQRIENVANLHRLLFTLYQDKKYVIDNATYKVRLQSLVISRVLTLYLRADLDEK